MASRIFTTGQSLRKRDPIARGLSSAGDLFLEDIVRKNTARDNTEIANADAEIIRGEDEARNYVRNNLSNFTPDKREDTFGKIWEPIEKSALEQAPSKGPSAAIRNDLITRKERLKSALIALYESETAIDEGHTLRALQEEANRSYDYNGNREVLIGRIIDYEKDTGGIYDGGRQEGYSQEDQRIADVRDVRKNMISDFIRQGALRTADETYIKNPNKLVDEIGMHLDLGEDGEDEKLFTSAAQRELEKNYRIEKNAIDRIEKEKLEDAQQENERGYDLRLADPDHKNPVSVTEIDNAYANNDIDQTAWKGFRKLIAEGPVRENDDEALMRVHEIEEKVRRGEMTSREGLNEIRAFKTKIKSAEYDSAVAGLPKLETEPEHVKTYFSLLDSWLTAGEGIDDNLLGDDELERAKNYNKYHKGFSEWVEANHDATLEQVDAAFKRIVSAPIVRAKVFTLRNMLRAMVPPPIQAAMLISKKRELSKAKKIKAEFPEAYYEDGKWYVKKDGKRFRVNEDEY